MYDQRNMPSQTLSYSVRDQEMKGFLAYEELFEGKRPGIIIAHPWRGQDEFVKEKALQFAKMGYVAMAADVYGNGRKALNDEEALSLMLPLFEDRRLLQERIGKAVEIFSNLPHVDKDRIVAIGFCFGGLTVLELLRSGAPVRGIVSFHGLLADVLGEVRAKRPPNAVTIKTSALFLHGADDPMVSQADIRTTLEELDELEVDWQFNSYSQTVHAFTNPLAQDADHGMVYNDRTAKRSWSALENFLKEMFA